MLHAIAVLKHNRRTPTVQARGSLHVHMAIWVKSGTEKPEAICGTAPRGEVPGRPEEGLTDAQLQWRAFVLKVQRHDCYDAKCKYKNGKRLAACRYGYPRELFRATNADDVDEDGNLLMYKLNGDGDRYIYRAVLEEDVRISPYVPLWLLATGASMNIQYCTSAGFLSYIAKYVCKPEPNTTICDSEALRMRNNNTLPQMRFLNARNVGAPEVVFRLFQFEMKHGGKVVHLCTRPPDLRRRALARVLTDDSAADPNELALRFYDGTLEQYARRPAGIVDEIDFEAMKYPAFHRCYEVKQWKDLTTAQRNDDASWRCIALPNEEELEFNDDETTGEPHDNSKWVVPRTHEVPIWWDWMLPSKHADLYFYQKLLLNVPWRDATPDSFISHATNPTGSLRQECVVRNLIPAGDDLSSMLQQDAEDRLF